MSYSKKYIFVPMSLLSVISFSLAQTVLTILVLVVSIELWSSKIGFFWTFILTFLFGLAPLTIFTAPFFVWYNEGFSAFLGIGVFFLMASFWFVFSKLIFSEDHLSTPENFLGYSPQTFLLGALSLQVIALTFYQFKLSVVGFLISEIGGYVFLILSLIAVFKWRALKKKLSLEEREYLYRPSIWTYVLGFIATSSLYGTFQQFDTSTAVINVLNAFFLIAVIVRFIGLFRRKSRIQKVEYEIDTE